MAAIEFEACATISLRDVSAVGANLPTVGTVRVNSDGSLVGAASYFDTIVTPGFIPNSTSVAADTVTFSNDPAWATGTAVRVVAGYNSLITGLETGLVPPPGTSGTTTSSSYFIKNLGSGTYSLHTSYNDAIAGTNAKDIIASIPTTGEIVITGENDALPFLGQTPINESLVPASTKTTLTTTPFSAVSSFNGTTEQIVVADTTGLANGDRVRVSAAFGGLTTATQAWVRVIDGTTVELYNSFATAVNTISISGRIGLSGTGSQVPAVATTLDTVDPDDETVTFAVDPEWATGTPVRVNTTSGNLSANTTWFVRNLTGGTYSFFASQPEALNTDANTDPLSGRRDLTAAISASFFANLNTLTFPMEHGWVTGAIVRVNASSGGLTAGTNYYVRAIDEFTISLHTSLANLENDVPITFNAPVTSLVTPMYDGWCIDNDRLIGSGEYIANIFSSYELSSFPDTTNHPKDSQGTEAGIAPINTSATPSTTDTTLDRLTFAANHGWANGQAVGVTATEGGLIAGTTYYVRSTGSTSVSFHPTAAAANNQGPAPASTSFVNTGVVPASTITTAGVETVTFASDPVWATGTLVRLTASSGGLTGGTNYYVQNLGSGSYTFHLSAVDAGADTNRVNLTGNVTAQIYTVTLGSTDDSVTFAPGHGFVTGDIVTVTASVGGLSSATTYTLYNVSGDIFSFHTGTPTAENKVNLTANVTAGVVERVDLNATISASTIVFRSQSIDFAVNHSWPNGTKVKVTVADGGLVTTASYYSRAQNVAGGTADSNSISLYSTRDQAIAGGTTGLITFTNPIETSTVFYVPEDLVENPENLDVMNWVLNQNYESQLADGRTPTATVFVDTAQTPSSTSFDNVGSVPDSTDTTAETMTFGTDPGWATATLVRADATGGGLSTASNYYVRNLGGGVYSFYNSVANATAGGTTGRINLTAAITADIFTPSLASTEDTITFAPGHGFVTGSLVNVTADGSGLDASTTYILYNVSGDTFSLHTGTPTAANKVNLTAAVEPIKVYLATDNSVTVPAYGWSTGMRVQVSATGGGLTAGTDYYIRALNTTALAFYATAADASNNVNRIDLTGDIQTALVRPYYTESDLQRTVWELIENSPNTGVGSIDRANEILAEADAAVGIGNFAVTYIPDCGDFVSIIMQPFEVQQPSNQQITIAQITTAQIPLYCGESTSCQVLTLNLGSVSGMKFEDKNGDGDKDLGDGGLSGWTIYVDYNNNGELDETEPSAVTDSGGNYSITSVLPGTYTVREVMQPGWVATYPSVEPHEITVDAVDYVFGNVDFGNFKLFQISGVKVWDIDRDGVAGGINDSGDQRIAGLRVFLDTDNDGEWDEGEQSTLTAADGSFSFTNLGPGSYVVREDLSSLGAQWQATAGTPLSYTISGLSGTNVSGNNFFNHKFAPGEYLTYSQGGWGGTGTPGRYLQANFATAFPNGLVVPRSGSGSANDIKLVNAAEVQAFLRANKKNPFTNLTVSNYVPSNLETQFVALSLSVGFDNETLLPNFDSGTMALGDLKFCNLTGAYNVVNDLTISQFLAQVRAFLEGSNYTLGLSSSDLINLMDRVTLGFDGGVRSTWVELYLC